MEQSQQPPIPQTPIGMQPALPNATAALVLGIISIPTCFCYGIIGMACGIIAIILGSKAIKLFKENPGVYNPSSFNNANAGRICGIIGTILSALYLVFIIVYFILVGSFIGSILSSSSWEKMH
ncbi:MAG: hypothetical protein HY063_14945 [Bacteroidetes bacterium]|nr:hypothetical protein [Bacteroidota bacterium]